MQKSSMSYRDRAYRRLRSNRKDGLNYEPLSTPSSYAAFNDSPMLYYTVYDSNLAPVRKNVVYAHSLEELHYMAIDNASRLETLDLLFRVRPDFNSRSMTVRDLILTAFVGTSDGKLQNMLVCPHQGDSPYDLDTTLYAVVMSELVPNSRQTPLRIAMNAPVGMKKWSHMSKLRMFGVSVDSKLIELNNRVNCSQVVELRNDPDGAVRYSQRVLDEIERAKNPPPVEPQAQPVVHEDNQALSNGAESGTAVIDAAASTDVETTAVPLDTELESEQPAVAETAEKPLSATAAELPTTGQTHTEADMTRAPIALVTEEPTLGGGDVDVSKISGPLQHARLEDKTTTVADDMATEANESHPAFQGLDAGIANETSTEALPTSTTVEHETLPSSDA